MIEICPQKCYDSYGKLSKMYDSIKLNFNCNWEDNILKSLFFYKLFFDDKER